VALVLVAGCAPPSPYPSGITGIVVAGPACPGPARLDSPCPDRPAAGVELAFIKDGAQAAGTTTFADGRFKVDVPAGTYTIRGASSGFPIVRELVVTVPADRHVEVTVRADSGIR
jgi:carboxypeptidase family protein